MGGPVHGGCLCGGVRFTVEVAAERASYCHCTRCQRRSGTAASAQAPIVPGTLRFDEGESLVRFWAPPEGWHKAFCSRCGSALFSRDPAAPDRMGVRLGVLDPGHGVRPAFRQFTAYAADWEPVPDDGLPRHPERAPIPE